MTVFISRTGHPEIEEAFILNHPPRQFEIYIDQFSGIGFKWRGVDQGHALAYCYCPRPIVLEINGQSNLMA